MSPDVEALIHELQNVRMIDFDPELLDDAATALCTLSARVKELEQDRLSRINSLILIAREARSSGNRTLDQCIDALAHIDDFCRAQLTGDDK